MGERVLNVWRKDQCISVRKRRREEQPVDVPRMAGWVELSCKLTRVKRVDKWRRIVPAEEEEEMFKLMKRHLIDLKLMYLNVSNWTCCRRTSLGFNWKAFQQICDVSFALWPPWFYLSHFRSYERILKLFLSSSNGFKGRTTPRALSRCVLMSMCLSACVGISAVGQL